MKKKIGDLTLKEAKTICDSRDKKGYPYCQNECPLYCICGYFDEYSETVLIDQEIEVEE